MYSKWMGFPAFVTIFYKCGEFTQWENDYFNFITKEGSNG